MTSIDCMTHNIASHLTDRRKRRQAGRSALERCVGGIGGLNEINRADLLYFRRHRKRLGLRWRRWRSNAVVWDPRVVTIDTFSKRRIMLGGNVGADGTPEGPDNRRVGPSRFALKWLGHHNKTGFPLMVIVTHKVAKSYTTAKWRLPLLLKSHAKLVDFVKESIETYPNGFIAGDENSIPYVKYLGLNDRVVPTPATYGNKRYDQIHVFGNVTVVNVKEWHSPSDHDGLQWDLVLHP